MLPGGYAPRSTVGTALLQIVRARLERFLTETAAATDGVGVPRFIESEFRDFLGCRGRLRECGRGGRGRAWAPRRYVGLDRGAPGR